MISLFPDKYRFCKNLPHLEKVRLSCGSCHSLFGETFLAVSDRIMVMLSWLCCYDDDDEMTKDDSDDEASHVLFKESSVILTRCWSHVCPHARVLGPLKNICFQEFS